MDKVGALLLGVYIGAAIQAVVGTIFDRMDRRDDERSFGEDLQERVLPIVFGFGFVYAFVVLAVAAVIEWLT